MLYSAFSTAVDDHLGVDANRRGTELMRKRAKWDAIVDLQRFIRSYRAGNTTTYLFADMTAENEAHLGTLPDFAKPKAFYVYSIASGDEPLCDRNKLDPYDWNVRSDLICGRLAYNQYVYALSPMGRNFLVYPPLNASTALLLVWDGIKVTFADGDNIPLPESAAEAVAAYVKERIIRLVDKRVDLAGLEKQTWIEKRRALYRDAREALQVNGNDEEYDVTSIPNIATLLSFGAQNIPFLRNITALSGVATNCLAAIPTTALSVPTVVEILLTLANEEWDLIASTAADDPTNGVLRPNDYNGTTNAKVWFKRS